MPFLFSFMLILSIRVRWRNIFSLRDEKFTGYRYIVSDDVPFFPFVWEFTLWSRRLFFLENFLGNLLSKVEFFLHSKLRYAVLAFDRSSRCAWTKSMAFSRITRACFIAYSWEFNETCIHVHVPLPIHENSMRIVTCWDGICVRLIPYSWELNEAWQYYDGFCGNLLNMRITRACFIAYSWEFNETCIHVHVPLPIHENSMRIVTCYAE